MQAVKYELPRNAFNTALNKDFVKEYANCKVRRAILRDASLLAVSMRKADKQECLAQGIHNFHQAIASGILYSKPCFSVVSKDESHVFAVFGAVPVTASENLATLWLLGSVRLLELRREFIRNGRLWVKGFLKVYPKLWNHVHEKNKVHIRWLKWAGFNFDSSQDYRHRLTNEKFLYFEMTKESLR